jgi:hypothetical protein
MEKIKESLALVGVNADAIIISSNDLKEISSLALIEADQDSGAAKVGIIQHDRTEFSLRDGLPVLAWHCEGAALLRRVAPTAKGVAAKQDDVLKLCSKLMASLDDYRYNSPSPNSDVRFPELEEPARLLEEALGYFIAVLKRCRNELTAMGDSRGIGNTKAHRLFWKELTRIFDAHVDNGVKYRNQRKINFLQACSAPYCPEEATVSALTAFVEGKARTQFSRK